MGISAVWTRRLAYLGIAVNDMESTHYHLFTLHDGTLSGWHLETLGDTDYFVIFDFEFLDHVPHGRTRAFDFLVVLWRLSPRIEVAIHKIGPKVGFMCDVKSRK